MLRRKGLGMGSTMLAIRRRRFGFRKMLLVPIALLLASCVGAAPTLDRRQIGELRFAEEFDAPLSLFDPAKDRDGRWKTNYFFGDQRGPSSRYIGSEQQIYSAPSYNGVDPFRIRDGVLIVQARPNPDPAARANGEQPFTSGLLTLETGRLARDGRPARRGGYAQRYGYFEIRAKLPAGQGAFPAIWLYSASDLYGLQNEIDIVETIGSTPGKSYHSLHVKQGYRNTDKATVQTVDNPAAGRDWQTYGLLWTPRDITWFVDGRQVAHRPNAGFHDPMYLMMNLAVGGDWGGPAPAGFSADMLIDYAHIYALAPVTAK